MQHGRKWIRFMTTAATGVLLCASCSSHGGGGSSPSAGSETTTASYTSYDSAGGYLNVEGGHYQTCTLTGNSTGGTIPLSNGTQANLTGTYGTPGSSSGRAGNTVSLAASDSMEIKIEGCWTITFNGVTTSGTYSLFATAGFISIRHTASNGSTIIVTAGAATDSTQAPAGEGVSIAPGSASDPFAGTEWGPISGTVFWYFENGAAYNGPKGNPNTTYFGPYTVSQTSEGYKICFNFAEAAFNYSSDYQGWAVTSYTITIQSAGATEGSYYSESYGTETVNGKTHVIQSKFPNFTGMAYKQTP